MLHARISFLYQYLQDVKDGVIPMDYDIIRQISTVCRRSPLMEGNAFNEQFSTVRRSIVELITVFSPLLSIYTLPS